MLVLALTSVVLASAPLEPATPEAQQPALALRRVELRVSSPQLRVRGEPRAFPASKITDLQFDASFAGRPKGPHVLELKLYTPRGYLYQVLTVPFTAAAGGVRRRVPGNPRVFSERGMRHLGSGAYEVSARLPVAGSWIMASSLYGRWRVDAHVDGAAWPSGRKRFTIQP